MPYPSQVDQQTIVQKAWEMIEAEGADQLSLAKLAGELGIKAPSLYRHVGNKASLMQAVNMLTAQHLFAALEAGLQSAEDEPVAQLTAVFNAYRTFAHHHPRTYVQAMTNNMEDQRPDENALEQMAIPYQEIMAGVSGSTQSLAALRGALALIHGFVMLELHGQLRRGGDLDEAFQLTTAAYLQGWQT